MKHQSLSKKQLAKIHAGNKKVPRIGDIVETPVGIGRVQHIKSDYETQKSTHFKVRTGNGSPKYWSLQSIKFKGRKQ